MSTVEMQEIFEQWIDDDDRWEKCNPIRKS